MSTSTQGQRTATLRTLPPPRVGEPEISVVLPCLNESETLATCIGKAQAVFSEHGIAGEVIVADNGSTDGSLEIAESMEARVVHVAAKGYGSALMGGIRAARGKYVIMADADDSYDLLELPRFLDKLREGYDMVQGCRLKAGGGTVLPGAMPFLHRRWGNPMFSRMARSWFKAPISDVYCGFRGFTKEFWLGLRQQADGMEFATEMIIRASLERARIAEVPITLHPDGRQSQAPHLRTFRDGWRTLRLYLLYSPRWLFLMPGAFLVTLGIIGYALALPGGLGGGREARRPHAAVREPRDHLRLPVDRLRDIHQDPGDCRRTGARRPALDTVLPAGKSGARTGDRGDCPPGGAGPAGLGDQTVAGRRIRQTRLRRHDAAGDSGRNADRPRRSDHLVELLREHPRDAPGLASRRRGSCPQQGDKRLSNGALTRSSTRLIPGISRS